MCRTAYFEFPLKAGRYGIRVSQSEEVYPVSNSKRIALGDTIHFAFSGPKSHAQQPT